MLEAKWDTFYLILMSVCEHTPPVLSDETANYSCPSIFTAFSRFVCSYVGLV